MQNDEEYGEQPIDVGLGNQRFLGLGAVRCQEKTVARQIIWFVLIVTVANAFAKNNNNKNNNNKKKKKEKRTKTTTKNTSSCIFFDLDRAYDTTRKHGILSDLYGHAFRGHLPTFIDGCLSHRLFQVRAQSTLFDTYEQEMGVPQGSILASVRFSLNINNIVKSVFKG